MQKAMMLNKRMTENLIDIYRRILRYEGNTIYIAFHSKTLEPYFHGKQVCDMLGYVNSRDAIHKHVSEDNKAYIEDIVSNYKLLYKNIQGHTVFITEGGLFSLIIASKNEKAIKITLWITNEVMPSIRKTGEYKLKNKLKKEIDKLNKELEEKSKKIEVLEHDLKKETFPEGGMVYLTREIFDTIEFEVDEILDIKFGRTGEMKTRKPVYDTATKHKTQVLKMILVKNPLNIERCVKEKMKEYKVRHRKELFRCTYNQLIQVVAECVNFFENTEIDMKPDAKPKTIKRTDTNLEEEFDSDKIMDVIISNISDNTEDLKRKISDDKSGEDYNDINVIESEIHSEENSNTDSGSEENNYINQKGGMEDKIEIKYLKLKIKYLKLKLDLL